MSAAKHTPGPWTATVGGRFVTAPETEDHLELRVRLDSGNPQMNKANARLIAAAPDMLAALLVAADAVGTVDALDVVRAAIAKATGRAA